MARAHEFGAGEALEFLREIDAINVRRRSRMVDLAREQCGGTLDGKRVAVLGAPFKHDSDDIRDSAALDIAQAARAEGVTDTVYDPKAMEAAKRACPALGYADSVEEPAWPPMWSCTSPRCSSSGRSTRPTWRW